MIYNRANRLESRIEKVNTELQEPDRIGRIKTSGTPEGHREIGTLDYKIFDCYLDVKKETI